MTSLEDETFNGLMLTLDNACYFAESALREILDLGFETPFSAEEAAERVSKSIAAVETKEIARGLIALRGLCVGVIEKFDAELDKGWTTR